MSSCLPIDAVELTEKEKTDLEKTMRDGNIRLKHWHTVIKRQINAGKSFSRLQLCGDLIREIKLKCHSGPLDFMGSKIPNNDLVSIKRVHDLQPKIMSGYIKIVSLIANKWDKKGNDSSLSLADLIAEGTRILLNCTYYYTTEDRFTTFIYHAIERRIARQCTRTSPLSEKTERATKLQREFQRTKVSFNGPCNFEEVCDKMGLDYDDRILLERLQIGVVGGLTADGKDKVSTDYSVRALNFGEYSVVAHQNGVGNIIRNSSQTQSDLNFEQIIKVAKLNEFESAVLEAWMQATDNRWRAAFSEEYISPKSGEKVTRQRVAQVAKDVERKIREAAQRQLQAA